MVVCGNAIVLCNAPATFENLIEKVLEKLQWMIILVYLYMYITTCCIPIVIFLLLYLCRDDGNLRRGVGLQTWLVMYIVIVYGVIR